MPRRNARWNAGRIDAEVLHPVLGWIPTTLAPDDPATAKAFAEAAAGYVAPDDGRTHRQNRSAATLSKVEFLNRAIRAGLLTQADAEAAARGDIPPLILTAIPAADREAARIIWPAATRIDRLDPFIAALGVALRLNDAQLDALFGIDGGAA